VRDNVRVDLRHCLDIVDAQVLGVTGVLLSDQKFLQALGERLRDRRLALKWAQQELARRCELHRAFVGARRAGRAKRLGPEPAADGQGLRVPLAELLDGLA